MPESAEATTNGPVPTPDCSSSALLAAAGVMRMLLIELSSVTTGTLVVSVNVRVVDLGERRLLGELGGDVAGRHLEVQLERGLDVLDGDGRAVAVLDVVAQLDRPDRGAGGLERLGQHQLGREVVADRGERLADRALHGDGGVELVELVVQADQVAVERDVQDAGAAGGRCRRRSWRLRWQPRRWTSPVVPVAPAQATRVGSEQRAGAGQSPRSGTGSGGTATGS